MTKVDIISGFLGAGKTTLIKKLLKEAFAEEKVVLIENEFGEIGIDGGFLKEAGIEVTEMNSGCICCSLVGDFGEALKKVLTQFAPDRILIEPSGVGKLSDVMKAVQDAAAENEGLILNSRTAVVDANKCRLYMKNFGEFFNNQIEHAGAVLLSRSQNVTEEKLAACVKMIKEQNPHGLVVTTPWDHLNGAQILEVMEGGSSLEEELLMEQTGSSTGHHEHSHEHHGEGCSCGCGHDHHEHGHEHHGEGCGCGHDHHEHGHEHHEGCGCGHDHHEHHHADEVFSSWGAETPHKYSGRELDEILEKLSDTTEYGTILRAKGMVAGAEGEWHYFDLVPGEIEVRAGAADYTGRICVIGTGLKKDQLEVLFQTA